MTPEEYKTASQACDMLRNAIAEGISEAMPHNDPEHYEKMLWVKVWAAWAHTPNATILADQAIEAFKKRFPK